MEDKGTPIRAAADGTIIAIHFEKDGFGNYVKIDHGLGVISYYAHLEEWQDDIDNIKVGQRIRQGEVIGKMGSTGKSTGYHLHFEVRIDGKSVDPRKSLKGEPTK